MSDSISVGIPYQENKHRIFSEVVFDLRMTSIHFECASTSIKNSWFRNDPQKSICTRYHPRRQCYVYITYWNVIIRQF